MAVAAVTLFWEERKTKEVCWIRIITRITFIHVTQLASLFPPHSPGAYTSTMNTNVLNMPVLDDHSVVEQ